MTNLYPVLRLHALRGKFEGLHSVSLNLSYRITLELLIQNQQVILVNVGDHDAALAHIRVTRLSRCLVTTQR